LMPAGSEFKLRVNRLDGGLNVTDTAPNLQDNESPDCLNVIFNAQGGVQSRYGSAIYNTETVGTLSCIIDGLAEYNGTMVIWAGGTLWRVSGTTAVTVGSAQSVFNAGTKVAHVVYQNQLFCSDGTNGPYRYTGDGFYRMGIATPNTNCTATSNVPGANLVPTGDWIYKISFVNTAVIEGEVGATSPTLTLADSAAVCVTGIPVGAASQGVASRYIYRASTATETFRYVGELTGNVATTYTDIVGATTWAVSEEPIADATAPTPFTTIKLHKEHLWFDDSSNRSLLRYTNYGVPYISEAANFIPLSKGDYSYITAIGVQDDYVSVFKGNSVWIGDLSVPGTTTTYNFIKSPANMGIVGPRALVEWEGGILFAGCYNGRITGFHNLSGINVSATLTDRLRSNKLSVKLDAQILQFPSSYWDDICMAQFDNAIYIAHPQYGSTYNDHIYWFDVNRLSDPGNPGSWALWDGRPCRVNCFAVVGGYLYGGSSLADAYIIRLNTSTYADPAGGYNSYWWSKHYGGTVELESWFKDWRNVNVYYGLLGDWDFNVKWREAGTTGSGTKEAVDSNPGGSLWGTMVWGTDSWGGGATDAEDQIDLGTTMARRIQFGFDNNYDASNVTLNSGVGFKAYRVAFEGTLRRYD